jgi:2-dehydro-3-deoxyphosphogluconate aldolase/(4S)-4-hydroxy-2-oxoglutarate aldolase
LNKEEVRSRIEEIGIIPAVRVSTAADAVFAAEAVSRGGIPIVEVTSTVPEAHHVISHLVQNAVQNAPGLIVGAGSVNDVKMARSCLDAGASFLTSDGFDPEIVGLAVEENAVVIPGTLTPSEVLRAWKLRPDFIKVVPCAQVGGESYIRALKAMFPNVPLIAAGGVNQQTASGFILAGAVALGIGTALIPREAIFRRQPDRIAELARRFIGFVDNARTQLRGE